MATCPGRRVRYPALGETHFKTNINTDDNIWDIANHMKFIMKMMLIIEIFKKFLFKTGNGLNKFLSLKKFLFKRPTVG